MVQFSFDEGLASDTSRASELEEKLADIFRLLWRPVFRYVVGIVGDLHGAEDVTQEVFLRLCGSVRKGETILNCRSWIFHVAYRLAVDTLRANGRAETVEGSELARSLERILDHGADPERKLLEREQNGRLLSAWSRLSPQEQHCLNLRAEGLSYEEIAAVLGIGRSSVGSYLTRGIAKIKKAANHD